MLIIIFNTLIIQISSIIISRICKTSLVIMIIRVGKMAAVMADSVMSDPVVSNPVVSDPVVSVVSDPVMSKAMVKTETIVQSPRFIDRVKTLWSGHWYRNCYCN